jgi:hypothetical protein
MIEYFLSPSFKSHLENAYFLATHKEILQKIDVSKLKPRKPLGT